MQRCLEISRGVKRFPELSRVFTHSYLQATVPLATETLTVMRKNRLGFQLLGPHDMTCKVGRLDEEG